MGSFNNIVVSERNQRPSFNGRTILRAYFMRDGEYVSVGDAQVSSVMLFNKELNTSPSSILDASTGLVTSGAAASAVWRWSTSGAAPGGGTGVLLSESQFTPTESSSCSSVYSVGTGRLAVVLNGINVVSSLLEDGTAVSSSQQLSGEPAAPYIDVWTVKLCANCDWTTFINDTQFFQNNAVILTEPLLLTTKNRLYNKKLELGANQKLKIGTEVIIENKNIDDSVKNVLRDGLITSGSIEILKHNTDNNLPSWVTVSGHADTSASVEITQDNTFLFLFNTDVLTSGSISNLGSGTGTYSVQVKYNVLEETIKSPLMYFTVV
tara:strand:+ start:1835 stop:2800 length:966 start_codon:yes stop_codon:yes gene_type:complete